MYYPIYNKILINSKYYYFTNTFIVCHLIKHINVTYDNTFVIARFKYKPNDIILNLWRL